MTTAVSSNLDRYYEAELAKGAMLLFLTILCSDSYSDQTRGRSLTPVGSKMRNNIRMCLLRLENEKVDITPNFGIMTDNCNR